MRRLALVPWTILLLFLACSDDGGTDPDPPRDLSGVSLAGTTGKPTDRIALLGLDGDPADYQLEVVDPDGGVRSGAPLFRLEDDSYAFPVPFHPDDPAEGGSVRLRVSSGDLHSELFDFTIEALPAASGGLDGVVAALRANLELRAALLGTTTSDLASASWESLDPLHVPLKTTWAMLDDPANENRLSELAAGRAPLLGEGALDVDLLDRLVDLLDATGFLDTENDFLSAAGSPPGKASVDIGSAEQLDWYMDMALSSQFRLEEGSAVQQFHQDLGTVMTLIGIIPHPAAQLASAGVGAVQFAYNTSRQAMANLLPSEFSAMEFELTHTFFNEDTEETGTWSQVDVWAKSKGWNADQAVVDGLLALASLGNSHDAWLNRFEEITATAWAENVRNLILDTVLKLLTAIGQNGIVEFDPEEFGPIDVTGLPWSQGFVLTDKIAITSDLNYVPIAIGEDQLEVRTAEGEFGGQSIELAKAVEVREIWVEVLPASIVVDAPGEVVGLQATVHNADHLELEWTIAPANWASELAGVGSGTELGSIETPVNEGLYPFVVSVESLSNTGLRATSTERRIGFSSVRLEREEIVVTPGFRCLPAGGQQTFTAQVFGVEDDAVVWSVASGLGTIDPSSGVYMAPPSGEGDATVIATSVENSELVDWAVVRYGRCDCFWEATVTGDTYWSGGGVGPTAGFIRYDDRAANVGTLGLIIYEEPGPNGEEPQASLGFGVSTEDGGIYPWVGDLGSYRIRGGFVKDSRDYGADQVDLSPDYPSPILTMTITESTETFIAGTIDGQMVHRDGQRNPYYISIAVEFRAGPAFNSEPCTQ